MQPLISAAHTPTPAQQSPNVRKPLAPYLPEANPAAPKDPVQAMNERQRAAIESRLPKNRAPTAGADSATTRPPAKSATTSTASAESTPAIGSKANSSPSPSDQSATPKTSVDGSAPAEETQSSESSSEKPAKSSDAQQPNSEDISSQSSSKRGPRYDVKTMKRWVEENPEQAAEIREHVFGFDPASNEGFIKLAQKKRAVRKEIDEHRETSLKTLGEKETVIKAHLDKVEATAKLIAPQMALWEAVKRKDEHGNPMPDFDAGDVAFQQITGMDIDGYMRMRARRGVADLEKTRLRVENARLKASQGAPATPPATQAASSSQSNGAAAPTANDALPPASAATKAAAPADLEKKWAADVPKTHKLRQIAGWAEKFDAEMEKYHDETLDEYSADPEQIADAVLKRELAALVGEPEEEEAPEPRARPRVKTPQERPRRATFAPPDHRELMNNPSLLTPRQEAQRARRVGVREGFEDQGTPDNPRDPLIRDRPERFGDRTQWAIARAQARARGELVDD